MTSAVRSTHGLCFLLTILANSDWSTCEETPLVTVGPTENCNYYKETRSDLEDYNLRIDCSYRQTNNSEVILREIDEVIEAENDSARDHIIELAIWNTPLVDIPTSICRLPAVQKLELHKNWFVELPGSCILQMSSLVTFVAQQNFDLVAIRQDDVRGSRQSSRQSVTRATSRITLVNLDFNSIRRLPDDWFVHMPNLITLSAENNQIVELQDGLFDDLEYLNEIKLAENKISTIGSRVFSAEAGLKNLTHISLAANILISIDTWPFVRGRLAAHVAKMVNIVLYDNNILTFTNHMRWEFNCADLQTNMIVYLLGNSVQHISDAVDGWGLDWSTCNSTTAKGNLIENPLKCDCVDDEYRKRFPDGQKWLFDINSCSDISQVCILTDQCPDVCRCSYRPSNATLHVDCSARNLSEVPSVVPPRPKTNVRYKIDFSKNAELQTIAYREYFANTSIFDASGSAVESIDAGAMAHLLSSADVIRLNANRLQTLPPSISGSVDVATTHLDLSDNPWRCSCNDRWIIGWLKQIADRLTSPDDILCQFPLNLNKKNILILTDEDVCADPFSRSTKLAVMISLSTIVGVVAASTVVFLVVRRCRYALFARYRFQPFDRDECVDEDMHYDVFLCVSEDDVRPHGDRILELLESNGYAVCFEERDLSFGSNISVNLSNALAHSKRTVCLVSENFLNR